ncbi:MAG: hypothetical protein ABIV47_01760 [Roseiflexaceae bacterium]
MDIERLVTRINTRHGTQFRFQGRYAAGENEGAFALADARDAPYVLKWNQRPAWLTSIKRAQRITNHLRAKHVPVPSYTFADTFEGIAYSNCTARRAANAAKLGAASAVAGLYRRAGIRKGASNGA